MTKFYSSKSNARRAAKQAFGDDFEAKTELVQNEEGFAYLPKLKTQKAATKSKRQDDEQAIRDLQAATKAAKTHDGLLEVGKQLDAKKAEMTEGVYESLRSGIYARADEITAEEEAATPEAKEVQVAAPVSSMVLDPRSYHKCPKCGSEELYAGRTKDGGIVVDEDLCGGCHHCDWEYDLSHSRRSVIDNPCRAVWEIADQMKGAKRKEVLEACAKAGIAYYTARTQYQLWRTTQKEMEQRLAQQASKS